MPGIRPLPVESLRRACDPAQFRFATTAELKPVHLPIGQPRAVEALRFGLGMRAEGYDLFALGPQGSGKHTTVVQFLEAQAAGEPVPPDWCYVNNFATPHRPRALRLAPSRGAVLRRDMNKLVEELRAAIPAAFESEAYRSRKLTLSKGLEETQEQAFEALHEQAKERSIALLRTPIGLTLAPMKGEEVLDPQEFAKLPPAEQERLQKEVEGLQEQLQEFLHKVPRWEKEHRAKLRELRREVSRYAVERAMEDIYEDYGELPEVLNYLHDVQNDVLENFTQFLQSGAQPQSPQPEGAPPLPPAVAELFGLFRRYQVNVMVDHGDSKGAPVVYEDQPSLPNLLGRIEHISQMGALVTDFTLIKPGALHRAHGGYLILDARRLLMQPFAWEDLKRVLRSREIRFESLADRLSPVSTVSLDPEPIPLDCKVILIGEPWLYYLLTEADPDFDELFKVAVDFDDRTDWTPETANMYAGFFGHVAREEGLRPLDRDAVAGVIEHAARLAGDVEKLSTRMQHLVDLVRESDYWAGQAARETVTAADVERAIAAQIRRGDLLRERMQEEIRRGTVLIDTRGEVVGQVNGLSVYSLGGLAFGRPSRITARVRLGRGEVVDIEREVELGGPIHSKGVLILSGFLGERFATRRPLALSASLGFEQSYSGVEGDSASSAELYALLSALAQTPVKQSFAVTGSVNQRGQVQAIGGANEKIEGFFEVCRTAGLTGDQGVLIPASNVKHLMLRREVVEAVAAGRFRVYAVETVDQGIELLTGVPAGEREASGLYPEGSINRRVEDRLTELAEAARRFAVPHKEERPS